LTCREEIKTVRSERDREEAKEQDKEEDCIVAAGDLAQGPVVSVRALYVANESHTSQEFPVPRQYARNADGP
jgi:hypothetical protein